jgi:hypothetical protein
LPSREQGRIGSDASNGEDTPPLLGCMSTWQRSLRGPQRRSPKYFGPNNTPNPISLRPSRIPATSANPCLGTSIKVQIRPGISISECQLRGLWVWGSIWLSSTSSRFILDFFLLKEKFSNIYHFTTWGIWTLYSADTYMKLVGLLWVDLSLSCYA